MLSILCTHLALVHHAVFNAIDARMISKRWTPHVQHDHLLSLDGTRRFSRAIIDLELMSSFAVVQCDEHCMNMYVCHSMKNAHILQSCLWTSILPPDNGVECIANLKTYMHDLNPDVAFSCSADMPDIDVWISACENENK